jgi:mRNA-degrading endonuclease RelE of RelBE toxin-antitoxin system
VPDNLQAGIVEGLAVLRQNPFPSSPSKKKLRGFGYPLYRLRTGDYRVLYRIDETIVTIMRVIDRKELDRTIKRLRKRH